MAITDSTFNAADYDVPTRFRHFADDTAEDHVGPFFCCPALNGAEAALRVQEQHCNIMGICHGGVLMMFADYVLGMSNYFQTDKAGVTIFCNSEFLSSAKLGELIIGRGEVLRETGSMTFMRADLFAGEQRLLSCSGAYKKLKGTYDGTSLA